MMAQAMNDRFLFLYIVGIFNGTLSFFITITILKIFFLFHLLHLVVMAEVQWIYANGSSWVSLDILAQQQIEQLWANHNSAWINCRTFPGGAYVDFDTMEIKFNDYVYAIARRC